MAYYNVHKRNTLDRLTLTYQLRMREVLRRESERIVRDFHDSIEADKRTFKPDIKGLKDKILPVFEAHRDRVIHVGVSDGIQEVSPDHDLGLWEEFPIGMPVEDTLSVDLAVKRDRIVREVKRATFKRVKVKDLTEDMLDSYLRNIRTAYDNVSKTWHEGESTVKDVIKGIQDGLRKTDNESERIFRTETTNYFNTSRHEYFSENTSVDYMELYAVTDGRISNICEERHGAVIPIHQAAKKIYMPAFHPNCRTIQRPLISALSSHLKIIDASEAKWGALPKFSVPDAWHRHAS